MPLVRIDETTVLASSLIRKACRCENYTDVWTDDSRGHYQVWDEDERLWREILKAREIEQGEEAE